MDTVNKACVAAARAVVPNYHTSPVAALLRESGILPARLELQRRRQRWGLALAAVGDRHPLWRRRSAPPATKGQSNLQRLYDASPKLPERVTLHPRHYVPDTTVWPDKDTQLLRVRAKLEAAPKGSTHVYTDGSRLRGNTACAATYFRDGQEVLVQRQKLAEAEVFDAELRAVSTALITARLLPRPKVVVFSDSQAAVRACRKGTTNSSQLHTRWARLALDRDPRLELEWCPAHVGLEGNERADRLAKDTAVGPYEPMKASTVAFAKAKAVRDHRRRVDEWWNAARPKRYKELGLGPEPDLLSGTRRQVFEVFTHRTGHGPFVSYLRRFGKEGIPVHECGTPREVQHLSCCRLMAAHRTKMAKSSKARATTKSLFEIMLGPKALDCFLFS